MVQLSLRSLQPVLVIACVIALAGLAAIPVHAQGNQTQGGSTSGSPASPCQDTASTFTAPLLVRDFRDTHPDFEQYITSSPGLVGDRLGSDGRPTYVGGDGLTTKENFDQWYRDVAGVNTRLSGSVTLTQSDGVYRLQDDAFFPADGRGFGDEERDHNFHFTDELHLQFAYHGGEEFTFTGDDDLWAFFNGHLGIDLGGVHGAQQASVALDELAGTAGLTKGKTYSLDIFHAERHTTESTYGIETTLDLACAPNTASTATTAPPASSTASLTGGPCTGSANCTQPPPPTTDCRPAALDENNYLAMLRDEPANEDGSKPSYGRSGNANTLIVERGFSFDIHTKWFSWGNELGDGPADLVWQLELMGEEGDQGDWGVTFEPASGPKTRVTIVDFPDDIAQGSSRHAAWLIGKSASVQDPDTGEPYATANLWLEPTYVRDQPAGTLEGDASETPYGEAQACTGGTTPDDEPCTHANCTMSTATSGQKQAEESDDGPEPSVCDAIVRVQIVDSRNVPVPAYLKLGVGVNLPLSAVGYGSDGRALASVSVDWESEGPAGTNNQTTDGLTLAEGPATLFAGGAPGTVTVRVSANVAGQSLTDQVELEVDLLSGQPTIPGIPASVPPLLCGDAPTLPEGLPGAGMALTALALAALAAVARRKL